MKAFNMPLATWVAPKGGVVTLKVINPPYLSCLYWRVEDDNLIMIGLVTYVLIHTHL